MRRKYIGGEFDDLASIEFIKNEEMIHTPIFPEKVDHRNKSFFETATDSFAAILNECSEYSKGNTTLWIPSHYCMETITRMEKKVRKSFHKRYFGSISEVNKEAGLNVVLINHFNEFNAALLDVIEKLKKEEYIVIEDMVHAPFDQKNTTAHYSFNSMRKVADIEVSVCYGLNEIAEPSSMPSDYFLSKKAAANLKSKYFQTQEKELETQYLEGFQKAEHSLNRKGIHPVYNEELKRFFRTDWDSLKEKREVNYRSLLFRINAVTDLEPLSGKYMYLITKAGNRNELRTSLFSKGIFPVIHWPDSHAELKNETISFHIDQRYSESDMQRTADEITQFYSLKHA